VVDGDAFRSAKLAVVEVGIVGDAPAIAAALLGGFAGGSIARALPLSTSLWIGAVLQTVTILAFSWQASVGRNVGLLTFAITAEQFTGAIGTVIFVAYLSALCKNPLHTATQFALLNALAALGRAVFSSGTGYIVHATGWVWFFVICALAGLPSLVLLWWLQTRGHFERLGPVRIKGAYAFKRLLQENGWLPLGTDFPVEDISPFKTFLAAVFRVDARGYPAGGFQMENALTREEAIRGMTIWAAKADALEKEIGSLEPGKKADFVILDKDLMKIPAAAILQTKTVATYSSGRKVF